MNARHMTAADIEPTCRGVDWRAVFLAAPLAGAISLAMLLFFVPWAVGAGNAATIMRYLASIAIGADALAPPPTWTAATLITGTLVHFALSLWMTAVIAYVLHRWGLLTGLLGGALFGLGFFAVHYYTLTLALPHLFAMSHWSVALVHAVFGALAGGLYEVFEFEPGEYAPAEGS